MFWKKNGRKNYKSRVGFDVLLLNFSYKSVCFLAERWGGCVRGVILVKINKRDLSSSLFQCHYL